MEKLIETIPKWNAGLKDLTVENSWKKFASRKVRTETDKENKIFGTRQ